MPENKAMCLIRDALEYIKHGRSGRRGKMQLCDAWANLHWVKKGDLTQKNSRSAYSVFKFLSTNTKIQQDHEIAKECSSFLRRNIGVIPLKWGNTKLKIVC